MTFGSPCESQPACIKQKIKVGTQLEREFIKQDGTARWRGFGFVENQIHTLVACTAGLKKAGTQIPSACIAEWPSRAVHIKGTGVPFYFHRVVKPALCTSDACHG